MEINLTEELVQSVLPNTLITVDEETPLSARIAPYVKDSIRWIESLVIGDVELPEDLQEMAVRAVIIHAFIHAIPALDIVVTPSGFGVISSQGLAPASKERVERLIASLSNSLNCVVLDLQQRCVYCQEWRESALGKWYCASFYPFVKDASYQAKEGQDVFSVYKRARELAIGFESSLAEEYLGSELMNYLREMRFDPITDSNPVVYRLTCAVSQYIAQNINSRSTRCPDEHIPWHFAESILNIVKQDKKLRKIWKDSMGKNFDVEPFKNTRKGGYFF